MPPITRTSQGMRTSWIPFKGGAIGTRSLAGGPGAIRGAFGITRKHFEDVDGFMDDLRVGSREFKRAENLLVRMLATTHQSLAQQKSRGMVTPTGLGGRPWGIPVRRITGAYYEGWHVKRIGPSIYMTYNDSREAYYIEFGINPRSTGVVRRPILKMSAVATLKFIQRTKLIERFTQATIGPTRNKRGQYRSFMSRMVGSNLMGFGVGPQGRLPD